ncbi:hypothetical protein ACFQO7_35220, partial [Catellatospora aurea]
GPPPGAGIVPGQRPPMDSPPPPAQEQSKFDKFKPDETGTGALEIKPVRTGRVIVMVVVGCALLLALAFGVLIGAQKLLGGDEATATFGVGDCLKQSGDVAVAAACTEPQTYKVVSVADSKDQCDKTQPHVTVDSKVLCLAPNTAEGGQPSTAPSEPAATPTP